MTQKTKTTTTHKTAKVTKKSAIITEAAAIVAPAGLTQGDQDAKNALLIVSLTTNAFILVAWVTIQVTNVYDYQVASFLFNR